MDLYVYQRYLHVSDFNELSWNSKSALRFPITYYTNCTQANTVKAKQDNFRIQKSLALLETRTRHEVVNERIQLIAQRRLLAVSMFGCNSFSPKQLLWTKNNNTWFKKNIAETISGGKNLLNEVRFFTGRIKIH